MISSSLVFVQTDRHTHTHTHTQTPQKQDLIRLA